MHRDANPYKPPEAVLGPEPPPEQGSAAKAVLLGFLVELGFTTVAAVAFLVVFWSYQTLTDSDYEDAFIRLMSDPDDDSMLNVVMTFIGGLGSAFGAYLCARIARHWEYRLGAVLILLSMATTGFLVGEEYSPRMMLVTLAITIAATMLGALVGVRRNRRVR